MIDLKCDICGKIGFKSPSGLSGHKQIMHGIKTETIKTQPDEIKKRLETVENRISQILNIIAALKGTQTIGHIVLQKMMWAIAEKEIPLKLQETYNTWIRQEAMQLRKIIPEFEKESIFKEGSIFMKEALKW